MEKQNKKTDKLTDKAFSRLVITSVIGILVCIACLCSTTFAWFTGATSSSKNTVVSGQFDLARPDVQFVGEDASSSFAIEATQNEGIWSCELTSAGTYTITLTATDDSTVKGHCVVVIGDGDPINTDAIIVAEVAERDQIPQSNPFTFTITVDAPTTLTLQPRWGVVASPDIEQPTV